MSEIWNKFDSGLTTIYTNYLAAKKRGIGALGWVHPAVKKGRVLLKLRYKNDLAEVEARGFKTSWIKTEGTAYGSIELKSLEAVASHPNVVRLSFGTKPKRYLDDSIPEIGATGSTNGWTVNTETGEFAGTTGKGVIIGIIDSGIDFRHKFFRKGEKGKTPIETRILRIWDQGLRPEGDERSPFSELLSHLPDSLTYGVEYREDHFNAVLQEQPGAMPVRHRDCGGHGTHVASIAAGDGRDEYKYIGVAPEADLIIVKYFDHENEPVTEDDDLINEDLLLDDAVFYILNVVEEFYPDRPVVINFSAGSSLGPHDGLTDSELFLDALFEGKSKRFWVNAAGNDANSAQNAQIEVPSNREITVPFWLYDDRTVTEEYDTCSWESNTQTLSFELWYPETPEADQPKASVMLPDGDTIDVPALAEDTVTGSFAWWHDYYIEHKTETTDDDYVPPAEAVTRHCIRFEVEPVCDRHETGQYSIKISSPVNLTLFAWCYQYTGHGFRIGYKDPMEVILLPPEGVKVENLRQIGWPAGARHVLAVAAYDAENGGLANFSSRGPLVSYDPSRTPPQKPDVAAPGWEIDAARSYLVLESKPGFCSSMPKKKPQTDNKDGTSMAAPHVTGLVALMFEINSSLSVSEIHIKLLDNTRPGSSSDTDDWGQGKIDVNAVLGALT